MEDKIGSNPYILYLFGILMTCGGYNWFTNEASCRDKNKASVASPSLYEITKIVLYHISITNNIVTSLQHSFSTESGNSFNFPLYNNITLITLITL